LHTSGVLAKAGKKRVHILAGLRTPQLQQQVCATLRLAQAHLTPNRLGSGFMLSL
jgi:hypothetical protein